jgi:hypothetical protein
VTTTTGEKTLAPAELAPYIQHTKIEVGLTRDEIVAHARETVEHGFNAAMVPASWVDVVAAELRGTGVGIATALDFPTVGVTTSAGKAAEAESIARLGATQLDIGVQIGWLKSGMYDAFRDDIAGVVRASGIPVKVMLELPLQTPSRRALDGGGSRLPEERVERADRDRQPRERPLPRRPGPRRRAREGVRLDQELPAGAVPARGGREPARHQRGPRDHQRLRRREHRQLLTAPPPSRVN